MNEVIATPAKALHASTTAAQLAAVVVKKSACMNAADNPHIEVLLSASARDERTLGHPADD